MINLFSTQQVMANLANATKYTAIGTYNMRMEIFF